MKLHPYAEIFAMGIMVLGALSIVIPVVAFIWLISQGGHLPCYVPYLGW